MINHILIYYTRSKYLAMKKQHIMIFDSFEELFEYRNRHNIKEYEVYKRII